MIKKIFTLLLMLVAVANANAQYLQYEQDTLRITLTNNRVYDYIWGNFQKLNFSSDFSKMAVVLPDNEIYYDLDKVKSIRFYNRYSNPEVVLKAQGSGTYDWLFQLSAYPEQMFYFISCLASDEMFGGSGLVDRVTHEYDLLINGWNHSALFTSWNLYLQAIYNANSSIVHLQNLPPEVSSAEQHHALGEALFMRAFYYYELASLFGTVPVVTDNKSWAQKMRASTPALVWGQILYDLKTAIAEMSENTSSCWDDSRVGKYAAEAMLARAYLFYTGFYLGAHDMAQTAEANVDLPDGTTLTKQDVIAYVEDCVKNSGFTLVPDYRNLWPYTNRLTREEYYYTKGQNLAWVEDDGAVNPEVLFKIKYNKNASWSTTPGYANRIALYLGMRYQSSNMGYDDSNTFPFGGGWGMGTVAPNLYDDWSTAEPQDMRRDASIQDVEQLPAYRYGSIYKDNVQETRYHEKKLSSIVYRENEYRTSPFELGMYGNDGWYPDNIMQLANIHPLNLIRFADVLLMHSELTGTVDGINQVRARAGLSPLVGYSLQALQQERRWELAFEGVRWNDMRRFGDDYCMAALDAQMNQPIYNGGVAATNPNGLEAYEADPRPYSARYAETKGFFKIPELFQEVGAMLIDQMQGNWTYDEGEQTLLLDYVNIADKSATRYDPAGKKVATGNFVVTPTDNFDQRICQITFTDGSMLPMSKKYSDNEGSMTYDVISLDDSKMVLKANGEELKLRRSDYQATDMTQIHGVKWSYGTYTMRRNWNSDEYVTYGTIGNYSWEEPYYSSAQGSIEGLYFPYIGGTSATDLSAFVKANNMTVAEGETDPFAYMVFDLYDNTIKKYSADGKLLNTGTFTLERGSGYVILHTSENATLVPYRYNGQVATVRDFDLRYPNISPLAEYSSPMLALMTTTMVDNMHTYWMFGQRGFTNEEFDKVLTIQQQEKDGTPSETGRFLSVNIDRDRFCIYVEDGETGEQIIKLNNNTPFMIKVTSGEPVTKKFRFRMKNCNDTECVAERTLTLYNPDPLVKYYIYGGPDRPDQPPFQPGTWDSAAMRFSDTEGAHLPTIPDDVYFGLKTLIFDVSDVSDDFDLKVMNGWWSATYYDHVKWKDGPNELQITPQMANDCAKGGDARDLDLMLYSGTMTLNAVYYEE
jgi:hypothetical protein